MKIGPGSQANARRTISPIQPVVWTTFGNVVVVENRVPGSLASAIVIQALSFPANGQFNAVPDGVE